MYILIISLSLLLVVASFILYNLVKKNESLEDYNVELEDFIKKQSEAIGICDRRLQQIDDRGIFISDDEIGWFFQEIKRIQEALNEFRLR